MNSTEKKQWTKNCPKCGGEQVYSSWDSLRNSLRKNTICNPRRASKCKIIPENGIWKRSCKSCGEDMIYSCRRAFNTGKRMNAVCKKCATSVSHKESPRVYFESDVYKQKMSDILRRIRNTDKYGENFKQKCRENKLKQIHQQGVQRTYNPDACRLMDELGNKMGIKLQHGMNGGEYQFIGYSLDGYDENKNVVFEYDEPKHHITSVKIKDEERQKRLIEWLHPSAFWRYDEKNNILRDVISGTEVVCQ